MLKELKEAMSRDYKGSMRRMSHQIKNINKERKLIKKKSSDSGYAAKMSSILAERCTMIVTAGNEQIKARSGEKNPTFSENKWLRTSPG